MVQAQCSFCKTVKADVRMRTDEGFVGPVDRQICQDCHERENASLRAEAKRFGYRPVLQRWESMSEQGAYSQVV